MSAVTSPDAGRVPEVLVCGVCSGPINEGFTSHYEDDCIPYLLKTIANQQTQLAALGREREDHELNDDEWESLQERHEADYQGDIRRTIKRYRELVATVRKERG